MWKWFRWVLLLIIIAIIAVCVYYWYVQIWNASLHGSELAKADAALSAGVTLSDPENDFIILESNDEKPNPDKVSPYRLPQFDIKSLQFGADQNYFYYKVTFYGTTPRAQMSVNGDKIHNFGSNFDLMESSGKITAVLHTDTGWWPVIGIPVSGTSYSTGPTGIEEPESARFSTENRDSKMAGGAGSDYQLGRFPLKTLGLTYGGQMNFDLEVEGGSDKYSHAAADEFLGSGKTPAMITWTIGSKNYQINNDPPAYQPDQNGATKSDSTAISDFDSCAKVYPVVQTSPEQCQTPDGKTFVEK